MNDAGPFAAAALCGLIAKGHPFDGANGARLVEEAWLLGQAMVDYAKGQEEKAAKEAAEAAELDKG